MNRSYVAARAAWMVVCLLINANLAHAQSVPAPWSNRDIGGPALPGNATSSGGALTIDAAGEDIWGVSDQFHFVYQPVSGDVDIRARVDSLTFANEWSKAGVMIRSNLSANAAHAYALVAAGRGVAFQRRTAAGGSSTSTGGVFAEAPQWVRVVRSGTTVSAFSSVDGVSWTAIGSDTIALGASAYVGIAVTSHNAVMRATASVSELSVTGAAPSTGEWSADIGDPAISGRTDVAAGTYTIVAAGAGVSGGSDQFRYVYRPVAGNVDVIARVESIEAMNRWSMAGVMIRESLAAGSRHAFALASSRKGYAFRYRPETNSETDRAASAQAKVPGWVRLVRTGALFEAFRSADGTNWTSMGSATINMAETAYVGLAVASAADATTTAVVSGVIIRPAAGPADPPPTDTPADPSPPPANVPPAVILSSPTNGATFTAPATVSMGASATDPDGTVVAVEFYVNSTLVGRDTTAPYAFSSSLGAGTYALKAVATDDDGATTISESVTVTVATATTSTAPRWVAFQASADHATLVSRYVLEIYAASAVPGITAPVTTSDLGKPAPSSTGEIMVDRSTFFQALPAGNYLAAVTAIGASASARSEPVAFTR